MKEESNDFNGKKQIGCGDCWRNEFQTLSIFFIHFC